MKLILLSVLILALASCASEPNAAYKPVQESFNSKYVRLVPDTNTMMLIENVKISYGDLYVEADSVLYERKKQSLTVFGPQNATFKDEVLTIRNRNTFSYKLGDERIK